MKVIVFDLDETIGNFEQLGIIWDILESETTKLTKPQTFDILDKFPKLLRPGLISLLSTLKKDYKIQTAIFTNNRAPPKWVYMFSEYLSYKIGTRAFNKIVKSWKIDGEIIEPCRTSHKKKYSDFLHCTHYPKGTKLCFLDDRYHEYMDHRNVYYIHVKPYVYHYPFSVMIHKLLSSNVGTQLIQQYSKTHKTPKQLSKDELYDTFLKETTPYSFRVRKTEIDEHDKLITQELKKHIRYFIETL